ncbi:MAG: hypothetical protein H7A51_09500 [Akkermansiaceae bacterium]|nr:hypothetical protein [Akkermansiaceae bacterium]
MTRARPVVRLFAVLSVFLTILLSVPCAAQDKKPLLLVRFVAVAKPPLPKIVGREGDNPIFKIQDEEAILPPGVMLGNVTKDKASNKEETSYQQSLHLMLNVATRPYRVKSPSLVLNIKGSAAPFAKITLPRESGAFTVYMARQPDKKSWSNAQVIILETPMLTTGKTAPRLVNFTQSNVGLALGDSKTPHFARPGRAAVIKAPGTLSHVQGFVYRQRQSKWQRIQPVSVPYTKDMLITIVCYPGVPGSQQDCILIDRIRREPLTELAARVKKMDALEGVSSKPSQGGKE